MPEMPSQNGHSLDHYVGQLQEILIERQNLNSGTDLLGWCHKNAPTLAEWLILNGFDSVSVVIGGLNLPDRPEPTLLSEAEKNGLVHYWVEVGDRPWVCDLATESHELVPGDYICLPQEPPEYRRFEVIPDPPAPYRIPEIRV